MQVRDHMTLTIAAATYTRTGRREADAHWQLGYTPVQFWVTVDGLLGRADVEAAYPSVVRRLRRVREARRLARTG